VSAERIDCPREHDTLILGFGNDIMGDDAIGLIVAREVGDRFRGAVDVLEAPVAGFALLDLLQGYNRVLLVDSTAIGDIATGSIQELSPRDFQQRSSFSPHFVGFAEVVDFAKQLAIPFPSEIRILVMKVEDPFVVREGLSPSISARVDIFIKAASDVLSIWGCQPQQAS
jgi:hydrogenase maturation protease